MYKEIFVVLCLTAFVVVQAYPAAEGIESQQPAELVEIEADPNSADDGDLEGSESRYGYGRRHYGGGWGRGYGGGGWGGGYGGGGWGGYGGYGGGGYGGYGGGWGGGGYGRGYGGGYGGHRRHWG